MFCSRTGLIASNMRLLSNIRKSVQVLCSSTPIAGHALARIQIGSSRGGHARARLVRPVGANAIPGDAVVVTGRGDFRRWRLFTHVFQGPAINLEHSDTRSVEAVHTVVGSSCLIFEASLASADGPDMS
jgi:hypothetical protein